MNVTQLKQKLAVLEAQGYGELILYIQDYDQCYDCYTYNRLSEVEFTEDGEGIKLN